MQCSSLPHLSTSKSGAWTTHTHTLFIVGIPVAFFPHIHFIYLLISSLFFTMIDFSPPPLWYLSPFVLQDISFFCQMNPPNSTNQSRYLSENASPEFQEFLTLLFPDPDLSESLLSAYLNPILDVMSVEKMLSFALLNFKATTNPILLILMLWF